MACADDLRRDDTLGYSGAARRIAGEHEIGPWNGHLILRTFREGVAARAGHDLVIEATRWQGTITIPDAPDSQPRLAVEVDQRQAPADRRASAGVVCVHHGSGRR